MFQFFLFFNKVIGYASVLRFIKIDGVENIRRRISIKHWKRFVVSFAEELSSRTSADTLKGQSPPFRLKLVVSKTFLLKTYF